MSAEDLIESIHRGSRFTTARLYALIIALALGLVVGFTYAALA